MRRRLRTTGIKREQKTNTEKHANKQKIIIKQDYVKPQGKTAHRIYLFKSRVVCKKEHLTKIWRSFFERNESSVQNVSKDLLMYSLCFQADYCGSV